MADLPAPLACSCCPWFKIPFFVFILHVHCHMLQPCMLVCRGVLLCVLMARWVQSCTLGDGWHLEEMLLDQAQARASYNPLFWGRSRSITQCMVSDV